jgi:hypothetical protein
MRKSRPTGHRQRHHPAPATPTRPIDIALPDSFSRRAANVALPVEHHFSTDKDLLMTKQPDAGDGPVRFGSAIRERDRYGRQDSAIAHQARRAADQTGHAVADGEVTPIEIEKRLAGHDRRDGGKQS